MKCIFKWLPIPKNVNNFSVWFSVIYKAHNVLSAKLNVLIKLFYNSYKFPGNKSSMIIYILKS